MSISSSSSTRRCMRFSISEIKAATNQFDRSKILGQGGEAKVYFAEIYIGLNKTPVAVKHLEDNAKEFEREIHTLFKIQHPNLVSLIGYCDESGHKILVYEYMAKGCLSDYLKMNSFISLSWLQRLNICLDVARGLQHLHTVTHEFPKGIIHRDVKPGNILVGENWAAKLSDFGMFKLSHAGQDKSSMIASLKGTSGYFAPEYIDNGCITRKIDVYSFGVVLFQLLCRKMPWDRGDESYYAREEEDLGYWAQQNVDAQIQGEILGDSLTIFIDIIRRSLQANPDRRPTMDNVVLDLQEALEWQETGRRPTVDNEVAYLRMALECQESENLTNQLERFDGFHHKSPRGLTEDRSVKQLLLRKALIVPETTSIRKASSQMASHMTDVLLLSDSDALPCGILTYKQYCRGMNYLHENKPDPIIHGALEPSNILRDNSGHLKVASFGVKEVRPLTYEDTTCRYVAPEVFRNEEYDTKVDVFSFALILQEMIEGCGPFQAKNENEVLNAYAVNERPPFRAPSKYYSYGLKELIKECWSEKPDKRPTFKKIIPRLESIYDSHVVQKPQSKVGLLKYLRKLDAMWKKGGSSQSSSSNSSQ